MNVNDELIFHNENFGVTPDGSLKTGAYHGKATRSCNNLISELSDQDVYDKDCSSISISEGDITVIPGDSVILHVNVNPSSSNTPEIIWESSDISVAYVTSSGILISQSAGEATITATSSEDTSIFDSITVTVSGESGGNEYAKKYLTTIARESGVISFIINQGINTDLLTSISYSTDNGNTWVTTNNVDDKEKNIQIDVNVNENDKVLWKGVGLTLSYNAGEYVSGFTSDIAIDVEGNILSLLYNDDFSNKKSLPDIGFNFFALFSDNYNPGTNIISAKNLVLPATTLTVGCYSNMFNGCRSLTEAPELLATTLAPGCYYGMFQDCTSLTEAPELPATILAQGCYANMFAGCISLTEAPELPATTLAQQCYGQMFLNCRSLTEAPELPATILASDCYAGMFMYCNNLASITCSATDISATNCTNNWVSRVAASGTFTKNPEMTSWATGNSGIPENWTIIDR